MHGKLKGDGEYVVYMEYMRIFLLHKIIILQLVPYGASIATKFQYVNSPFIFFLTHYMFRLLLAIFRWDTQSDTFKDYSCYNGSVARTQLEVEMLYVVHRYFDSWSPVHVIKLSTNIKIVKLLKFSVKTGPIYKMLKYRDEWAFVSPRGGLGGPPSFVAW
jgi:hypothetical protein